MMEKGFRLVPVDPAAVYFFTQQDHLHGLLFVPIHS